MYLTPREVVDLLRELCGRCCRPPAAPRKPRLFRIIFVKEGTNVPTAVFVFDVPAAPVHPGDEVTSRALSYTINGADQPAAAPSLTDVSFTVPTPVNPGDVVAGTLVDTNSTGAGTAATATGTCPTPGAVPPTPSGFSVTFTA